MLEQERNADNKIRCDLTAPKADQRSFETKLVEKRDLIADLQASLEWEKRQIVNLNSALERERLMVASKAASIKA